MATKRLISFNKNLTKDFVHHIENTNNLCVYKLGGHHIPQNIRFPKAESLTLINCGQSGLNNILHPKFFPNLTTVNYLSTASGNHTFHTRFPPETKWIFPNKNYDYYNFMVEAGFGKKDPDLIKRYIANKKLIDGKNGFDISFQLDLTIPGYGIANGDWWQYQFYEYLVQKQGNSNDCLLEDAVILNQNTEFRQEIEEEEIEKERVSTELQNLSIEDWFENE